MKQKMVIMSWLVFSTISLSSILADTNQSQADPNQNKPQKPHPVTFEDNEKFKTVGSPQVSKDGKWIAYTLWEKLSPLNQIHKVTTPTVFLCGQKDWNVPVLNSELMYQSLKRLGVETQLVVYPNSHHGGWKKQFSRDYSQRALAWMDKYVKKESVIPDVVESKADNK